MARTITVGVISDTHGLLRPEALEALRDADQIVHAGDVGSPDVIDALRALAPLTVVRGNNDVGAWANPLPETATVRAGRFLIHVVHDLATLGIDPAAAGVAAVVSGHSHRAAIAIRAGVHFFNPGSAGPRRFRLPVTLGRLRVGDDIAPEIVELEVATRVPAGRRR